MNIGTVSESKYGLTIVSEGGFGTDYTLQMENGLTYTIAQEAWNMRRDYYVETLVYHLSRIVADLKKAGNPLKRVLEVATGRGTLSIGIALLTDDDTRIVSCDIEEGVRPLVYKNAAANGVRDKIEVRIGNLLEPVRPGEQFDLIVFELPCGAVDPQKEQEYLAQGFFAELRYIAAGPDGRYFIDQMIAQANARLQPGGAILWLQNDYIGVQQSLDLLDQHGFAGQVVVRREWPLHQTRYTRENRAYIERTCGYRFMQNAAGEEVFFLTAIQGIKMKDESGVFYATHSLG